LGEQYDLHSAATHWIDLYLNDAKGPLVQVEQVYFELTKESKVKRIADICCTVYVDDLPEILNANGFPVNTHKILFDPDTHHPEQNLPRACSWGEVHQQLESQWVTTV
jgi:hypothetical protein